MARFIFARHGESEANRAGWMSGHVDTQLTELGRVQARELGVSIAEEPITRALSSDLCRAVRTAEIALEGRAVAVVQHPSLRERDIGEAWERADRAEMRADGRMATLMTWTGRPPGGESQQDIARRALETLGSLPPLEGVTLVVAHGGVLRVLFGLLDGLSVEEIGVEVVANAVPFEREVSAEMWAAARARAG